MMKKRYTQDQVIAILKESRAGLKTPALCNKYGISEATFYHWKSKFGEMTASEAKKVNLLEQENRRLRRLLADATLDNETLKDFLRQEVANPQAKRAVVRTLTTNHDMAVSRACGLIGLSRSLFYYESKRANAAVLP